MAAEVLIIAGLFTLYVALSESLRVRQARRLRTRLRASQRLVEALRVRHALSMEAVTLAAVRQGIKPSEFMPIVLSEEQRILSRWESPTHEHDE